MIDSSAPYVQAWRVHKRRDRQFWGTVLAWPLVTAVGGSVLRWWLNTPAAIPIVGGLWMIVIAVAVERNREFRCPRCGHHFYGAQYRRGWGFVRQCSHCGLRKWASSDAPAA